MDLYQETIINRTIDRTVRSLNVNQFETTILETKDEVIPFLERVLPINATVALGGSMTLESCGVVDWLRTADVQFIDRYAENVNRDDAFRQGFNADVFICSSNALTVDGELINMDGAGNRVGAMIFGPKKVYVIVGINKLVFNQDEGIKRIKHVAAPANCERLGKNTPCRQIGECVNCHVQERICSATVIMHRSHTPKRIHVVIVKENLGY